MSKPDAYVAIVDDDAAMLRALARLLGAFSIKVLTYESPLEFIDSLQCGVPTCLITDLQMPEMTGLDLQIYLISNGFKIPTIIITAHDDAGTRQQCEAAGAMGYLRKPLSSATLIPVIKAVTGLEFGGDH